MVVGFLLLWALSALFLGVAEAGNKHRHANPLAGRGAAAWSHSIESVARGRCEGGVNRLHAHAVADSTGLGHYLPQVKRFLRWCREQAYGLGSAVMIDRAGVAS